MEWQRAIDGYCERMGPEYWAEPVNALTNIAFILVAVVMWRRAKGVWLAQALVLVLFAIGLGSWLFHTHAQVWAALADTVPILCFILLYVFAINRYSWHMRFWVAIAVTALFIPYTAALVPLFQSIVFMEISAVYWPVPLLIAIYAVLLRNRDVVLSRGLAIGAALLVISLTFRSLDDTLCTAIPVGTHFMWHILNAAMLGWMIEVFVRLRARQSVA